MRASSVGTAGLRIAAVVVAAVAVVSTWRRLFLGMDLQDESFYVLVPWRWALGDRPFIDEQNLAQMSGLIEYPLIKLFAVLRDNDVTGLVLYGRHLYLALMVCVAVAVFLLLRRLVRGELALVACLVFITYIFWCTPQLSYNTLAAAFLTLGAVAASWTVVLGRQSRWYCVLSGAAYGLAVVAYPSLLFIMPFFAVALALAMGDRAAGLVATGRMPASAETDAGGTGRRAGRAVLSWSLGGVIVLGPVGIYLLTRGVDNLRLCWDFTFASAATLDQLGGADKAVAVAQGYLRFLSGQPGLIVAALVVYLVFLRWRVAGRLLLVGVPFVLLVAGERVLMNGAGYVLVYAVLVPYLYLFVPAHRREVGARLLLWVWAPAVLAALMVAYTSAAGYIHGPVGLLPAVMPGGLFLAWALEAVGSSESACEGGGRGGGMRSAWLALGVLALVVTVSLVMQSQYQQRSVPRSALTRRFDFGPWYGIKVTPERYGRLRRFAEALERESQPADSLLCFYQGCGYYLFWAGDIAANSTWLSSTDEMGPLAESTYDFYRRNHEAPTLAVHLLKTEGLSDAELQEGCGGLEYPVVFKGAEFALHRKPADETVGDVLARLPGK